MNLAVTSTKQLNGAVKPAIVARKTSASGIVKDPNNPDGLPEEMSDEEKMASIIGSLNTSTDTLATLKEKIGNIPSGNCKTDLLNALASHSVGIQISTKELDNLKADKPNPVEKVKKDEIIEKKVDPKPEVKKSPPVLINKEMALFSLERHKLEPDAPKTPAIASAK